MPLKPDNRLVTATTVKSGSTTTAVIDGVTTVIQVARDLTVAVGDVLFVSRYGSQWFALGRAFSSAPVLAEDNDTAPDPATAGGSGGVLSIAPVSTGSWNGTRWRTDNDDVYQGSYGGGGNHTGAVFYGTKPRSLAGATVLSATMHVRRLARGLSFTVQPSTMWLVTDLSRPSGAPALGSSSAGPALDLNETDTSFDLPTSWVQQMVDGTAGGIGFFDADGSPFLVFAGRGAWGAAFTMTVRWIR